MNLLQSVTMMKLKEQQPPVKKGRRIVAAALAKARVILAEKEGRRFDGYTEDEVANILFVSKNFTLMEVPLNKIASPGASSGNRELVQRILAEGINTEPIVVDYNARKIGKSPATKYYPPIIVVDGKERFEAAMNNGEEKILAWVGNLAAERFDIRADHQMSTSELEDSIVKALNEDLGVTDKTSYMDRVGGVIVYPLENYCIYRYKGQAFKQKYVCDMDDRTCTLVGPPKQVVQKWQDADVKAGTMATAIAACACQQQAAAKTAKASVYYATKDGKPVSLQSCIEGMAKHIKSGKFKITKDMEAKAPPGWENTVKHMKKHDDIDNPWALAWWMDDQGYESHK